MSARVFFPIPFVLLLACDRPTTSTTSTTVASASAMPAHSAAAVSPAAPAASLAKPAPTAERRSFHSYQGKVEKSDFRIVFERTGDKLEGIAARGTADDVPVRGEMKDASHFTLTEVVGRGKKGAVYEGKMDGLRIIGTVKDPRGQKPVAFNAGPPAPFVESDKSFEQTYLGSLGEKVRVRMKLTRNGTKLSGTYRYTRSKDDLRLEGTVNESDGKFELVEKTAKGVLSGRFEGVFLQRGLAFARWSSPDNARTFPITLRYGDVYPEPVTIAGAVKIVPQEDYKEQGKYCVMSIFVPEVVGAEDKTAMKSLNQALRAEAGDTKKMDCEGASEELRYETTTTYHVDKTMPGRFALTYSFYEYAGGAHGMHGVDCYVADVTKGTLTQMTAKSLSADARKKLEALTNASLKKEHGVAKLSDVGFDGDDVKLGDDTSICIEGSDLVVQFQPYEVAPYVMGAPAVKVAPKEAAPLVSGTAFAPFF